MNRPANTAGESHELGVVVGVDGSTIGLEAVRWGAAEARQRRLPLRILHAAPYVRGHDRPAVRRADAILARAFTVARRAQPDLAVATECTEADPVPALLEATRQAQLLVVGMGGGEGAFDALLTSVALDVSAHAACPVAVVRAPRSPHGERSDVVVGVDAPTSDLAALEVAFADARRHGDGVVVVHARHRTGPYHDRVAEHDEDERAGSLTWLTEELAAWTRRYPDVPMRVEVRAGTPVSVLLTAAIAARLVVVGTRGRRAAARVLLGSTSRQVLRRCPVPVIVINPDVSPETLAPDDATNPAPARQRGSARTEPHDHIELR